MTQAQIITLANAVTTELNSHTFSQPFTAERGYLPTYELTEMDTLRVTVVPKEDEASLDTRSLSSHEFAIDIGVQKKPPSIEAEHLDPLMCLVEEIADFLLFYRRPADTTLVTPSVRILYLPEHLLKLRQFTSVLTLTFKGWRSAT